MLGASYFLGFAVLVAAIAAAFDWRTGHIPNWVTLVPLGLAPLAHAGVFIVNDRAGQALAAGGFSVLGAALCALVPVFLYRAGGLGGGDVKLFAAIGAICRPMIGIEAQFYGFIAAALFAPARLAYEGKLLKVLANTVALVANPFLPKERRREITPEMLTWQGLGPAIFVGTCATALMHWRPEE
jgi:prepilin peptidase CpaA